MSTDTIIGLAIVVGVILLVISMYNQLVTLKNRFKNSFAQIDVQLQRRYELIPNLVESAKAYMSHERETLAKVMEARNQASNASKQASAHPDNPAAMKALSQAESKLTSMLGGFYAVAENYPDLKANETVSQLMEELTSTENRVSFARQAFNDAVMNYNTYREQFPSNIIAGMFGFKFAELLEIDDPKKREAVKVSFN
ncbi:LemA family protein [Litoribacillus peritrichatus]|uniref:LemA family protein n=1 Tax=Litoribacillus peritrichatus TaxID=718191 RepID=A0ABP7MXK8_9GAMM